MDSEEVVVVVVLTLVCNQGTLHRSTDKGKEDKGKVLYSLGSSSHNNSDSNCNIRCNNNSNNSSSSKQSLLRQEAWAELY